MDDRQTTRPEQPDDEKEHGSHSAQSEQPPADATPQGAVRWEPLTDANGEAIVDATGAPVIVPIPDSES